MAHFSIREWLLPLGLLALLPAAQAAPTVAPEQWLLEQVRIGEAGYKHELVQQSLHRLELIDPDNPEVIAARVRLALSQGDAALAQQQLARLKAVAPQSAAYRQAALNLRLVQPAMRQKLQQARLLATAGRLPEAKAAYDELFGGEPPTLDLAVEYWRFVARLPGQAPLAIGKLQALDRQYPGNVQARIVLARLFFSQQQDEQGFAVLRQIAVDPLGRNEAADLWLERIRRMPVSPASAAAYTRFLAVFEQGIQAASARQELARQQAMLADPAFQARLRGLALIDQGSSQSAMSDLQKALAAMPDDSALLGALGQAYARIGNRQRALELFRQALAADQSGDFKHKWQSLIKSTGYWLAINEGNQALAANDLARAQRQFQQARQIDGTDAFALVGLGDVAVKRHDDAAAERYYQQALRLTPGNDSAVRALVALYQRRSPQQAIAYIDSLPRAEQQRLRSTLDGLRLGILRQEADALAAQQQWRQAAEKYRLALQLDHNDAWLTYRYAQTLRQLGQPARADAVFLQLVRQRPVVPARVYAYALYLSSSEREQQALAQLQTLPQAQWDDGMRALAQRLNLQLRIAHAERLRAAGDEAGAIAYLRQQPADRRIDLLLADWALARGEYAAALASYQRVLAHEPDNADARLGEVEAYVAAGRQEMARQRLRALPAQKTATLNSQRRVANAWRAVGDLDRAAGLFTPLKAAAQQQPPGQDTALVYRDAALLERERGQPAQAQQDFQQAMVASGITPAVPQDNAHYTALTRNAPADDWLKRGIRADAADLYRQQDINVTLGHDYWGSSGTGGISDYQAHDTMLQVDMPLDDGRAFFRTDTVRLDAGRFTTINGQYSETFGTCATVNCSRGVHQKTTGTSVAAGWKNAAWAADLGTTPMGFEVVDWVGGLSYSGDWRQMGWTLLASRRPISSSLLAFGGARDPNTGTTWGGVRATGVSLSASYDRGGAHGVWADLSAHQLTGKNVEDNLRERLMAGYYYKMINEDNRRATVGLNTMMWHYQRDLSGYSLGQGGYYSPQRYISLGLPVNYRQRTENWSFELGGSLSVSYSKTQNQRRYPLQGLVPASLTDRLTVEEGSASSGIGYTLRAVVERRLTSHWALGAGVDIQQAKDYAPSHALLYLRYSWAGWQGDLDLPPQPLTPYADFK